LPVKISNSQKRHFRKNGNAFIIYLSVLNNGMVGRTPQAKGSRKIALKEPTGNYPPSQLV
jgi:hypothetical protein